MGVDINHVYMWHKPHFCHSVQYSIQQVQKSCPLLIDPLIFFNLLSHVDLEISGMMQLFKNFFPLRIYSE